MPIPSYTERKRNRAKLAGRLSRKLSAAIDASPLTMMEVSRAIGRDAYVLIDPVAGQLTLNTLADILSVLDLTLEELLNGR